MAEKGSCSIANPSVAKNITTTLKNITPLPLRLIPLLYFFSPHLMIFPKVTAGCCNFDQSQFGSPKKASRIVEANERGQVLSELLGPLSKEKRELMGNLLESVATEKLKIQYNKYLPTILESDSKVSKKSHTLNESQKTEVTGNKAQRQDTDSNADIINLRKLAGIN